MSAAVHQAPQAAASQSLAIRRERAAVKRELREASDTHIAQRRCAQLILNPPTALLGMQVFDLVSACRYVGAGRTAWVLRGADIRSVLLVRELTDRQRRAIAQHLVALETGAVA